MATNKMNNKKKSWMIEWDLKRKTTGCWIIFVMLICGSFDILACKWISRNDIDEFKWIRVRWFFTWTDEKGALRIRSFVSISGSILIKRMLKKKTRNLKWNDKKQLKLNEMKWKWKWLLFKKIAKW